MYAIELGETVKKKFKILEKKDKKTLRRVMDKLREIVEEPHREKPLRKPMQNMRRVHIRPFVLVYSIDELGKTVILEDFDHHDKIYK
jgi:YafQ family addiction module toxin component